MIVFAGYLAQGPFRNSDEMITRTPRIEHYLMAAALAVLVTLAVWTLIALILEEDEK